MRAIKTKIGKNEFLIDTFDDDLEIMGEKGKGRATKATSITTDIKDAYGKAKEVIIGISGDLGNAIERAGKKINQVKSKWRSI